MQKMGHDYKKWHNKKELINQRIDWPFFHEREVWFCYLGANVGSEQDGKGKDFLRPIAIIKKFNNEIFWAVPLTKAKHKATGNKAKYYFQFSFIKNVQSVAILSQVRLTDAKRLARLIGKMSETDFIKLKQKFKELLP